MAGPETSDTPIPRIVLTRHGLSEHNLRTEVYMGRSPESRLLPLGRAQAARLAARLARQGGVERIVCSSLPRTVETAEIVAATLGLGPVQREDAFWELSKGAWEGAMPRVGLPAEHQRALAADPFGFRYPDGESYRDVVQRVAPAFERCVRELAGHGVLFVLHGDVIRAVMHHVLQLPPARIGQLAIDPCSLTELRVAGPRYELLRYNDTGHLEGA